MLKEKAGVIAGTIWNALNETEGMTAKQLKKATKLVDKDLFLGLGWLLREDKVSVEEVGISKICHRKVPSQKHQVYYKPLQYPAWLYKCKQPYYLIPCL